MIQSRTDEVPYGTDSSVNPWGDWDTLVRVAERDSTDLKPPVVRWLLVSRNKVNGPVPALRLNDAQVAEVLGNFFVQQAELRKTKCRRWWWPWGKNR